MPSDSQQLRQSLVFAGAGLALALVLALAVLTGNAASGYLRRQADDRGRSLAGSSAAAVSQYLRERRREAEALASSPAVVATARAATDLANARGLPRLSPAALEQMFSAAHHLGTDPALTAYLREYVQRSDLSRVFFTDAHGYTVLGSSDTRDFSQGAKDWWRQAVAEGEYEGQPGLDSLTTTPSMEYDVAVRASARGRPLGALRAIFPLDRLNRLLSAAAGGGGAYLEVLDGRGELVATTGQGRLLQLSTELGHLPRADTTLVLTVSTPRGDELVVAAPANDGKWRAVYRQPAASAYAGVTTARRTIWFGALVLLLVTGAMLWGMGAWLNRRVTEPVREVGRIASRVASGDLSVTVTGHRADAAEVGDLFLAVQSMVVALRKLVGAIRSAADEAAAMAAEISASTQEMSASTEEMSATCQDLTQRAADQAQLVRQAADDAAKILSIMTTLAAGAAEAARRNADLAGVARRHRETLDQSTVQLGKLAADVQEGAVEAEALATAAAEIERFVTQAKAVATQTNTLALNAAIEAARAGPQGRGFAVVADEVRKLASQAAASAGETADTVRAVLSRVQATRDRLVRLAAAGSAAQSAAQSAAEGLGTVSTTAEANDAWSREIANSADAVRLLVEEIATRLASVAKGTDELLASAEEISASSEEQSASTQEIASSAHQLATAADSLTGAVQSFRLLAEEPRRAAAD
jgi:methyl-accepting chemotaxis protein